MAKKPVCAWCKISGEHGAGPFVALPVMDEGGQHVKQRWYCQKHYQAMVDAIVNAKRKQEA